MLSFFLQRCLKILVFRNNLTVIYMLSIFASPCMSFERIGG